MTITAKIAAALALALAVAASLACGGTPTAAPTPTPEPPTPLPASPAPAPTAEASPTPAPSPTAAPTPSYSSDAAMNDIFPGFRRMPTDLAAALAEVVERDDTSLVPVLVEVLRFMPTRDSLERVGQALRDLTGQQFESLDWDAWVSWLGRNIEFYQPPPHYAAWKARVYADIDPRIAQFILPAAEFSRIALSEVTWGGVATDGIPDLKNPRALSPDEIDYLSPDDRVFGVSINGERKAYPLRIVNAHEMVNDTVGGEPISLMW